MYNNLHRKGTQFYTYQKLSLLYSKKSEDANYFLQFRGGRRLAGDWVGVLLFCGNCCIFLLRGGVCMIIFYFPLVLFLSFFWGVLIAVIDYSKKNIFPKSKFF